MLQGGFNMRKKRTKRANGEGTIFQRKDKRWVTRISVKGLNGKNKLISEYSKDFDTAHKKLIQLQNKYLTGRIADCDNITVWDWLNRYLNVYKKNKVRESTYSSYYYTANKHIKNSIGNMQLKKITPDLLQQFYDSKKNEVGSRSISLIRQLLNNSFQKAITVGMLDRNPNDGTEISTIKYRQIQPFTPKEISKFIKIIDNHRNRMAIRLVLSTGLRLGELLALQCGDIDLKTGQLTISRTVARVRTNEYNKKTKLIYQAPKTATSCNTINIPPMILKELKKHILQLNNSDKHDLLFPSITGTQQDPKNCRNEYKKLLKQAGLPDNTFHALRHTFGSLLYEEGIDLKTIKEMLRHKNINTTADIYVKMSKNRVDKANKKIEKFL